MEDRKQEATGTGKKVAVNPLRKMADLIWLFGDRLKSIATEIHAEIAELEVEASRRDRDMKKR